MRNTLDWPDKKNIPSNLLSPSWDGVWLLFECRWKNCFIWFLKVYGQSIHLVKDCLCIFRTGTYEFDDFKTIWFVICENVPANYQSLQPSSARGWWWRIDLTWKLIQMRGIPLNLPLNFEISYSKCRNLAYMQWRIISLSANQRWPLWIKDLS